MFVLYPVLGVLSSFAIILMAKRYLVGGLNFLLDVLSLLVFCGSSSQLSAVCDCDIIYLYSITFCNSVSTQFASPGPEAIKLLFMLKLSEHESLTALRK